MEIKSTFMQASSFMQVHLCIYATFMLASSGQVIIPAKYLANESSSLQRLVFVSIQIFSYT
jgi:ABC-type uncharacterized transport system permease subunit